MEHLRRAGVWTEEHAIDKTLLRTPINIQSILKLTNEKNTAQNDEPKKKQQQTFFNIVNALSRAYDDDDHFYEIGSIIPCIQIW